MIDCYRWNHHSINTVNKYITNYTFFPDYNIFKKVISF